MVVVYHFYIPKNRFNKVLGSSSPNRILLCEEWNGKIGDGKPVSSREVWLGRSNVKPSSLTRLILIDYFGYENYLNFTKEFVRDFHGYFGDEWKTGDWYLGGESISTFEHLYHTNYELTV